MQNTLINLNFSLLDFISKNGVLLGLFMKRRT